MPISIGHMRKTDFGYAYTFLFVTAVLSSGLCLLFKTHVWPDYLGLYYMRFLALAIFCWFILVLKFAGLINR
jgi:hypothetical protein